MMDVDRATGAAKRRRDRRLRSWWRRHHSAGPREEVVTRREERQEGEVHEGERRPTAQTTPFPGTRPAPLPVVAGSQGVWPGAPQQPGCVVPSVVKSSFGGPGGGLSWLTLLL